MTPTDIFWPMLSYSILFGIYVMFAVAFAWQASGWLYDKWSMYRLRKIHKSFPCVNRPCIFGCSH